MSQNFPSRIKSLPPYSGRFTATQLSAEGCEIFFASYPAGMSIETHQHATDNHGIITRGAIYITVDGVETRYGLGDWYNLPAGTPHSARCEEDTDEIEFWFTLDGNG